MPKTSSLKISFWLFSILSLLFLSAQANAATITFTADTALDLSGAGTTIYIENGSAANSLTVATTSATSTVDASIPAGTTFTLSTSTSNILALTAAGNTVWLGFDTNDFGTGYIARWVASSSDSSAEVDFTVKVPKASTNYKFTIDGVSKGSALSDSNAFVGYNYTSGFSSSNLTFVVSEMTSSPSGTTGSGGTGGGGGGGGGGSSTPVSTPTPTPTPTATPTPTPTATPVATPTATPVPTSSPASPTPTPEPSATPAPAPVSITGIPSGFTFASNLKLNQIGNDIKYLQIILNSDPDTRIADSGPGSSGSETIKFGQLTKAAVIKFQEKYAAEILTPVKLTKGTGIIGSLTRNKLNALMGTISVPAPTPTPTPEPSATPAPAPVSITGVPSGFSFANNLKLNQTGDDIKYLQILLNSDPDTRIADSGPGSPGSETMKFGMLTKAAVIKFQEKYAAEILTPVKLTKGTGFVGQTTRNKLNQLLGGQ